ncbi:hypothetical protein K435DRAFT_52249 [Dendrothele bispora CBS 962.96]|uniref:Uncharacterized protein n=1 Tax=Dendrothele bispora (strain CBS 962.96) TaxID=1314807 RepID=A0A4S8M698_DENBC|nr:hypothetical protein K435DRAFT_52249 [Dendrothele bispora CBS 962.96]
MTSCGILYSDCARRFGSTLCSLVSNSAGLVRERRDSNSKTAGYETSDMFYQSVGDQRKFQSPTDHQIANRLGTSLPTV